MAASDKHDKFESQGTATAAPIIVSDKKTTAYTPDASTTYQEALNEALEILIAAGGPNKDSRSAARVFRKFSYLRHNGVLTVLANFAGSVLSDAAAADAPSAALYAATSQALETLTLRESAAATVADGNSSFLQKTGTAAASKAKTTDDEYRLVWKLSSHYYPAECKPNVQVFISLLVLVKLIDAQLYSEAVKLAQDLINFINTLPRRILDDNVAAKAYFFYSRAFELNGNFQDVRQELMTAYRLAVLHRDSMKQAVTLTSLLRNYIHFSHYDLAIKLVSKASLPENLRSNSQSARYLYYLGLLQAVQQDYSDAHASLLEAVSKAPQPQAPGTATTPTTTTIPAPPTKMKSDLPKGSSSKLAQSLQSVDAALEKQTMLKTGIITAGQRAAKGFRLSAYKFAIVVELLMGGVPDRAVFNQHDLRRDLYPYRQIVDAVRSGDLTSFRKTTETYKARFEHDRTLFLIQRLHRNVIRTGIRTINLSYSNINLSDVATKLGLESAEEAEGVASRAVVDGVIDGIIDHDSNCLRSKPSIDLYTSHEPAEAFHKRIAFCLQLHNEAIESMQYPEDTRKAEKQANEAEARRKEMREHLARAEEGGEEDEDDVEML